MKKIIISSAVVLTAAFVGMPYVTGMVAEKASKNLVDKMNADSSIYGSTEILSYERGFRSTKSSFSYSPPIAYADIGWTFGDIEYECDGSHGVLGYSYDCNLTSAGGYIEFINEHLSGKDPLSFYGDVSIFGKINQNVKVDAFSIKKEDGELTFNGGLIETSTTSNLTDYVFEGELGDFTFSDHNTSAIVGKSTMSGDIFIAKDKLQFGTVSVGINSVDIKSAANGSNTVLDDLKFITNSTENGDTVAADLLIDINQISVEQHEEKHDINKLHFGFYASGLDRDAVAKINEISQNFSAENGGEPSQEQVAELLPLVEKMLKKDLSLSYDFKTDYQGDTAKSDFKVHLIDSMSLAESTQYMFDPDSILEKLTIKTSNTIPGSFIAANPGLGGLFEVSPMFKADGNGFKSDIVAEKDNVTLNGEETTLVDLFTIVMQSMPR